MPEDPLPALLPSLAVMAGGAAGAWCRYAVAEWLSGRGAPLGVPTLVVNVTGSFAIGLLATLLNEYWEAGPAWRLLLVTGFLGGYTTFSALSYETLVMARAGRAGHAALHSVGSLVLGFAAVWLAHWLLIQLRR